MERGKFESESLPDRKTVAHNLKMLNVDIMHLLMKSQSEETQEE